MDLRFTIYERPEWLRQFIVLRSRAIGFILRFTMPMPARPIDRTRLTNEARAKIFWGDSREEVIAYLVVQGIPRPEATPLVDEFVTERAKTLRGIGFQKFFTGCGLILVPIISWFIFLSMRVIPVKIFAVTIMVGLYGVYLFLRGLIMLLSPRAEHGDVADQ